MNETSTQVAAATAETTVTASEVQPVADGAEAAAAPKPMGSLGTFLPLILLFGIFYFMMIRPQQRKEKERRKMIDELRAGAKVIFAGGIVGTIVEASEKSFVVETVSGKMEVLRSCVQGVVEAPSANVAK